MNILEDLCLLDQDASYLTTMYLNIERVMAKVKDGDENAYDYLNVQQFTTEHYQMLISLYQLVLEKELYLNNPSWLLIVSTPFLTQPLTGRAKFMIGAYLGKILASPHATEHFPHFDVEGFFNELENGPLGGDSDDWLKWGFIINYQLNTLDLLKSTKESEKALLKYKIDLLYKHVLFEHEMIKITIPELLPHIVLSSVVAGCAYKTLKKHYGIPIEQNVLTLINSLLPRLEADKEGQYYQEYYNAFVAQDIHEMIEIILKVKEDDQEIGSNLESLHLSVHNPGALTGPSPSIH